ncbi:MAG: cytochrome c family protein [Pseudomonadota bacterium]
MTKLMNSKTSTALAGAMALLVAACGGSGEAGEDSSAAGAAKEVEANVKAAAAEAKETAAETAEAAGETMNDVADKAANVADDAADTMKMAAGDAGAAAKDAMADGKAKVGAAMADGKAKIETAMADASDKVAATAAAVQEGASEVGAELAGLTGDAAKGKRVFVKCMACHAVQEGQNRVGPSLYGIVGRAAGSVDGFNYSEANANSGIVWSENVLFEYLEAPQEYIPGTRMIFQGLPVAQDRADVIAYLKSVPQ